MAFTTTTPTQYEFLSHTYASDILCKYANMAMPLTSQISCQPQSPTIYHIGPTKPSNNLLHKSVIYDSGASVHVTYDRARFIDELEPIYEWLQTPAGDLLIEGWATMMVVGMLNGRKRELKFKRTAYVTSTDVTLVSVQRLKMNSFI